MLDDTTRQRQAIRGKAMNLVHSRIKAFLEQGDMSIWKDRHTATLPIADEMRQKNAEVTIELPPYRIPPYEQRANVGMVGMPVDSGAWMLDQVAPLVMPQELPAVNPDTDKTDMATQLVQTIKPGEIIRYNFPERKKLGYDFTDYRISGNPLVMLFGASIEAYRQFNRLPDILFISRRLEPALERESMEFYGAYDGRFRCYHPKALAGIKKVPVMTETHLPDELKLAFERDYPVDCVIALVEK